MPATALLLALLAAALLWRLTVPSDTYPTAPAHTGSANPSSPAGGQVAGVSGTGGCAHGGEYTWRAPVGGKLRPLAPASVEVGTHPYAVAVSPDGSNVYVANYGSASVSQLHRNTHTGGLAALSPAAVAAAGEPHSVTVSGDGRDVYVVNADSEDISQYARNTRTGALTALSPATVTTSSVPRSIALSPDGKDAYVANTGDTEGAGMAVSQYARNTKTGALTALSPATVQAGLSPRYVVVSGDGRSVYVASYDTGAVTGFTRDTKTGALENPRAYGTGGRPFSIAISPDDGSVYVANYNANDIAQFSRNRVTGALRALAPAVVAAGVEPHSVVVSADGENVYVTNATPYGTISQYARNMSTGALTAMTPAAIETGTEPTEIVLSPDGRSAYVTNHRSTTVTQYARARLSPRLSLSPPVSAHGKVVLAGRVVAPLTRPVAPIVVWQRIGCARGAAIARIRPSANGAYKVRLSAPAGVSEAFYRTTTSVRSTANAHTVLQTSSREEAVRLH